MSFSYGLYRLMKADNEEINDMISDSDNSYTKNHVKW